MNQHKKFESQQQQEVAAQHQAVNDAAQEFARVEDLLRHDAAQTEAPLSIAHRLQKSTADFPSAPRSWWQKLLGQ